MQNGPLRVAFQVTMASANGLCDITQNIYLTALSNHIEFETTVNWRESHKILKGSRKTNFSNEIFTTIHFLHFLVEFPVQVHAMHATFDSQYCHVERPTHWNTTYDAAKFEVCGHKFGDLSEHG